MQDKTPLKTQKRVRPRVERDEVVEIHEDENSHLWAVSYSDFLMALLSFFILFYSVDDAKRDQLILQISHELAQGSKQEAGFGAGNGAGLGAGHGPGSGVDASAKRLPANLAAAVAGLDISVSTENESMIVNFPDNIFPKGRYNLQSGDKNLLTKFLEISKPYQNSFNFYFEGHTDSAPLVKHKTRVITDNYVLSSMRAFSALDAARAAGYPEKNLFIQADSSNTRNSRSLSIRLERKKESL